MGANRCSNNPNLECSCRDICNNLPNLKDNK
jgi:hypothetical protein